MRNQNNMYIYIYIYLEKKERERESTMFLLNIIYALRKKMIDLGVCYRRAMQTFTLISI
jgi:hypothetical protein